MRCGEKAVGWCLIRKTPRRQRKRTRCSGPLLYARQKESIASACWRQGDAGTLQALAREQWGWTWWSSQCEGTAPNQFVRSDARRNSGDSFSVFLNTIHIS